MFVMTIGFHYHIIIHDVVYLLDVPDLSLWNRVALCSRIYIYFFFSLVQHCMYDIEVSVHPYLSQINLYRRVSLFMT